MLYFSGIGEKEMEGFRLTLLAAVIFAYLLILSTVVFAVLR